MKAATTTGLICLRDDLDIEYKIAKIEYTEYEDEHFTYVFTPYYEVIDLLSPPVFQGIPGLDLDLRKPQYVRENIVPVFVSERSPGRNRDDLWTLLDQVGMTYLNQLEWLMRTKTRYSGDRFYVKRPSSGDERQCVELQTSAEPERAKNICRKILSAICFGHDVKATGFMIDNSNRKAYYSLLMLLYRNEIDFCRKRRSDGIKRAADDGKYRGRQRIQIDDIKAFEIIEGFRKGKITEVEALEKLGVSRATFYRRLKEHKR